MRLRSLMLENYRAFKSLEIDLQGKSAVIAGPNGSGKSAILSAICCNSRPWLYRLNRNQGKSLNKISSNDVTVGETHSSISYVLDLEDGEFVLRCKYTKPEFNQRARSGYDISACNAFVQTFEERFLTPDASSMPIFAYYGTNRSVAKTGYRESEFNYQDMRSALGRATDNRIDFDKFFEWYYDSEADEAIALREDGDYEDRGLFAARRVICSMLDGVTDLRVRRNPRELVATKDGHELVVDLLSDGEKCTLALLGDLARRLALANPGLDNPLDGDGIVLIDEIDLHLHPAWQRRILGRLTENFPQIQFIVTTHSPQVLSEVDDEFNIFTVDSESHGLRSVGRLDGFDSNTILEERMLTPSRNARTSSLISSIYDYADEGLMEKALEGLAQYEKLVGPNDPEYILAEGYLRRAGAFR